MTPGLALFYGGMVRGKNVLGMLMQNFFAMGILAVLWVVVVFTLAFGDAGNAGLIGNFDFVGLKDVGQGAGGGEFFSFLTIPFILFCAFQMTFAIITPALITGATADRMKFGAYAVFIVAVVGPRVRAGRALGVRRRLARRHGRARLRRWRGRPHQRRCRGAGARARCSASARASREHAMPPHNLPLTMIGTGILWFGWAGFNAGSALAANGVAASGAHEHVPRRLGRDARLAARRADQGGQGHDARRRVGCGRRPRGDHAVCRLRRRHGRRSYIGAFAGIVCCLALGLKKAFKFDDSLDVIAVHLVGGLVGSILLGFFADASINAVVTNEGVFLGGGAELLNDQVVASVVVAGVLVRRRR